MSLPSTDIRILEANKCLSSNYAYELRMVRGSLMLDRTEFREWDRLDFNGTQPVTLTQSLKLNGYKMDQDVHHPYSSAYATWDEVNDCEKDPPYPLAWPVFSKVMLETLLSVGNFAHLPFPISINMYGNPDNCNYIIVQLLDHLDIFDPDKSIYDPADIDGTLTKLVLKEPLGGYPPLFRVATIPNRLFVSAAARAALEAADIKGLEFRYLENFAWSKPPQCEPFQLDCRYKPLGTPRDATLPDAYCPTYAEFGKVYINQPDSVDFIPHLEFDANFEALAKTDYPDNSEQFSILSKRMLEILLSIRDFPHQTFPVIMVNRGTDLDGHPTNPDGTEENHDYVLLHLTEHLDSFDWEQSEYEMNSKVANHADRLSKLVLKEPSDGYPPIFRMSPISDDVFISAEARETLEIAGIKGLRFQRVQDFHR
jgi:hypothetical protein